MVMAFLAYATVAILFGLAGVVIWVCISLLWIIVKGSFRFFLKVISFPFRFLGIVIKDIFE